MAHFVTIRWAVGLMAVACVGAQAQSVSLIDPTRPPDAVAQSADGVPAAPTGPQLQMVLMRQGAKPRALISGEWVEQGGVYGAFRVVRVESESVILAGDSGRETLRLTPQVALQRQQPIAAKGHGAAKKKEKPSTHGGTAGQTNGSAR